MTSPVAGKALRYLIGVTTDSNSVAAYMTELGYDSTSKPAGTAIAYVNCRQEKGGRRPGVDYIDPPDDIEQEYGEPAFKFGTTDFWFNLTGQLDKWRSLGFEYAEVDNLDTYDTEQALEILDRCAQYHFWVLVKNPTFVDGDSKKLIQHPNAVAMICEQDDNVNAHTLDDFRDEAGHPDFPIRVVTYGDQRPWAVEVANGAANMTDFGVTYSSKGEYQSVEHLKMPTTAAPPVEPILSPTPWVEVIRNDLNKYHDPDAPMLAQEVGRIFPSHAAYAAVAGPNTAWCGIYVANKLSKFGIEPPYDGEPGVHSWMYVDSWLELKGGTRLPASQKRDGDLALWMGKDLHHISFVYEDGYLGGNQNNTVNISYFRTPDAIIRPPAPENYTPTPDSMPLLMIESQGDSVRYLQTLLNADLGIQLEIDGDFGPATEAAVKQYQAKYGLEVDGIVGPETWGSLMAPGRPLPEPIEPDLLTSDQVIAIMDMAKDSAIAEYSWKGRGLMPIGCCQGLAVMYAQSLLRLQANDSTVLAMSNAIGSNSKDALAYYGVTASGRVAVLRKAFVMLYGLSMRESSGNYTEGRDTTASNVTSDTAEAGLFQQSWNSNTASQEMTKLLPAYQNNPDEHPCYVNVFKQGITPKVTKSYGSGDGYEFQELAKKCPAFATEMAAVGIRVLYNHWGPIVRQEVEMRAEAETLLVQIDAYMAEQPVPEPPPIDGDGLVDTAAAKAECMAAIEKAVDKLIADIVGPNNTTATSVVSSAASTPGSGEAAMAEPAAVEVVLTPPPVLNKTEEELQAVGAALLDALLARLAKQKGTSTL